MTAAAVTQREPVYAGVARTPAQEHLARFHLIGSMRVLAANGADILPAGRKTRALLACLCLSKGERVSRGRLIGLLWDRSGDEQARMSLRQALSQLNVATARSAPGVIEIDREAARVNPSACWIDVQAMLGAYAGAPGPLELLTPYPNGRLLEDLDGVGPSFDHWLSSERSRFEDAMRGRLESELEKLLRQDARPELRAAAARRLLNFEPTHEAGCRALMMAFGQMGDRGQAIREYERLGRALRLSLDLAPARETQALYDAIKLSSAASSPSVLPEISALGHQGAGASLGSVALKPRAANAPPDGAAAALVSPKPRPERVSIAVLPFHNLTADTANEQLCEGLAEDLIEALSRVPDLFVISRLSTMAFKQQPRLPQEIGDLLGVRYVLSGSMRASGGRIRLTNERFSRQPAEHLPRQSDATSRTQSLMPGNRRLQFRPA